MLPCLTSAFYKAATAVGFDMTHDMSETAIKLNTDGRTESQYHEMIMFPEKHLMKHKAFIVGVEKSHWKNIGAPEKLDTTYLQYREGMNNQEQSYFYSILENKDKMFISHIAHYTQRETQTLPNFLYNAYASENADKTKNAYQNGFNALDTLEESLKKTIRDSAKNDKPYTHIFVGAMGWNTTQEKALKYFDRILDTTKESAIKKGYKDFNPLFVGLTWPSVWGRRSPLGVWQKLQHVFSYPDKTVDADNIGYTIGSRLINDTISGTIEDLEKEGYPVKIKTVLIGHSLGARLLASATYGRDMLKDSRGKITDLLIGLQGAFSIRRFVKGEGIEGAPYRNHKDGAQASVMTYSFHDKAVPLAEYFTGALHVGAKNTKDYVSCPIYDESCRHKADVFIDMTEEEFKEWSPEEQNDKVLHIDTSIIMPDGHSHIDTPEVGAFIIDSVYKLAPERQRIIASNECRSEPGPI